MIDRLLHRRSTITIILTLAMYSVALFSLTGHYLPTGVLAWLQESYGVSPRAVGLIFLAGAVYLTVNLVLGRQMDIAERYLATLPIALYVSLTVAWSVTSHAYQAATMYLLLYVLLHIVYLNPNGGIHGH